MLVIFGMHSSLYGQQLTSVFDCGFMYEQGKVPLKVT